MAIASKWIKGVDPKDPVSRAARRAARQRLRDVKFFLPLAAYAPQEIENIHQLRVATRRAVAALCLYQELIPPTRGRRLRKLLKHVRRAANDARDLDVLIQRLRRQEPQLADIDISVAIKRLKRHRKAAQQPVVDVFEELRAARFENQVKTVVQRIRWRADGKKEPSFGKAARTILAPVVDEFFEAAAADFSDVEALHEMRIRGKALRYALELLSGAFGEPLRKGVYPHFVDVQDELGVVNDHATAEELFRRLSRQSKGKAQKAFLGLASYEAQALEASADAFRSAWKEERLVSLRQEFEQLLADPKSQGADVESPTPPASAIA